MKPLLTETHIAKLNSLTKYPSIPTYHALGQKGRLTETVQVRFDRAAIATEKIDGTNARMISVGGRVLVGSREDFLWATGDLIHNPAMGIVAALRDHARALVGAAPPAALLVVYGEVYGRNIGAGARNYTSSGQVGFRVFDAFQMPTDEAARLIESPAEQIAARRESGGQPFLDVSALDALACEHGFERVPALGAISPLEMPESVAAAAAFLAPFAKSAAVLDGSAAGRSEGIVVRSRDRRQIAKLRFEDYQRTLRQ